MNGAQPDAKTEVLMQEMLQTQIDLDKNVKNTAKLLRFALALAGENLGVIREQLERLQVLSSAVSAGTAPQYESPVDTKM